MKQCRLVKDLHTFIGHREGFFRFMFSFDTSIWAYYFPRLVNYIVKYT